MVCELGEQVSFENVQK